MPQVGPSFRRRLAESPELRAEREEGALPSIVGYAAVFDSTTDLGWFTESIARGAFTESLSREDDVRALFNHDPNMVLGRNKAGSLTLVEDEKGLRVKIIPPDTQLGRDLITLVDRGDVSQMSFGFYIDEQEASYKADSKTHWTIKKASLFDVSVVTFPAYEQTKADIERALRTRQDADLDHARAAADLRRRKLFLLAKQT